MKALSEQELHNLVMNYVGKELEAQGYEFMAVNSKLKKHPQFVCLKDKQLHFILVEAICYPRNPHIINNERAEKMRDHAQKFEGLTYYAAVGLHNTEDPSLPIYLNQPYTITYPGLKEIK